MSPSLGTLKNLSAQWGWGRRAAAYDRWIERQNLEQAERSALEQKQKWEQRDQERRESDYALSLQLREHLQTMLKYPLVDQQRVVERYEDGREKVVQTFKAAGWRKSDIVRFWLAASAIGGAAIRNEGATSTDTKLNDVLKFVDYKSARKGGKDKMTIRAWVWRSADLLALAEAASGAATTLTTMNCLPNAGASRILRPAFGHGTGASCPWPSTSEHVFKTEVIMIRLLSLARVGGPLAIFTRPGGHAAGCGRPRTRSHGVPRLGAFAGGRGDRLRGAVSRPGVRLCN